jgi:ribosomal protein S18 acetylase RimI-like enzyme
MIIRNYQPGDFPQIEILWKETGIFKSERGDTPEIIELCNAQGGRFLIMEDERDHRVTGTTWLTWDGRRVLLHHFAVLPSMRRKGYGRELANASLEFARQKKCPVKLEVNRHNFPAVQLYRQLGFKVFENYEVYIIYFDA